MIDISKLKELVNLMTANDLSEVELKGDKESITIKRAGPVAAPIVHYAPAPTYAPPGPSTGGGGGPATGGMGATGAVESASGASASIDSPMVGTFYASPNPDVGPFVKPGQTITPDTVVCIIEAMKVFNEIKAEKAGVVEGMLVKNGQSVEFGQRLFTLK